MWYGKAPGVDRSGDAFRTPTARRRPERRRAARWPGDDPASKSSTCPGHSEVALYDALMPVLYPGNVQEILDLGLHGFVLSRCRGLWVGVKIVTNVADEAGTARGGPGAGAARHPRASSWTAGPGSATQRGPLIPPYGRGLERDDPRRRGSSWPRRYAAENRLEPDHGRRRRRLARHRRGGQDLLRRAPGAAELGLDDAALRRYGIRMLKLGMLCPMEPRHRPRVRPGARGDPRRRGEAGRSSRCSCKDVLYGRPTRPRVRRQARRATAPLLLAGRRARRRPRSRGPSAARLGRTRRDRLRGPARIEQPRRARSAVTEPLARPRARRTSARAARTTARPWCRRARVAGGGHRLPRHGRHGRWTASIIGLTQMGGEGAQWVGIAPFTDDAAPASRTSATARSSTPAAWRVSHAVAAGVNITYKILYNGAVAMTGGQTRRARCRCPSSPGDSRPRGSSGSSSPPTIPTSTRASPARRRRRGLAPRPARSRRSACCATSRASPC